MRILDVIDVDTTLGESIVWDERCSRIYLVDIVGRELIMVSYPEMRIERRYFDDLVTSVGLYKDDVDKVVLGLRNCIVLYSLRSGVGELLCDFQLAENVRLNDGRVSPEGNYVLGSMHEPCEGDKRQNLGAIFELCTDYSLKRIRQGLYISNGIAWSPSANLMYFSDSYMHMIWETSTNTEATIGEPTKFAKTVELEYPDGATVDTSGCLWVAIWGGSSVRRYSPDGHVLLNFVFPAKQISCVTFGGTDMQTLFVTSAKMGLNDSELERYPKSGSMFVVETPYIGLTQNFFG